MQVLKCKCGKKILFTDGENFDCLGCDHCKTNCAETGSHKDLQPHTWSIIFDETEGAIYRRCAVCGIKYKMTISE